MDVEEYIIVADNQYADEVLCKKQHTPDQAKKFSELVDMVMDHLVDRKYLTEKQSLSLKVDMTEEQLNHIKNAFAKYDKKSNGIIRPKYLVKVLRKLGLNPSEEQVDCFLNEILIDGKKKLDFLDVIHVATTLSSDPDTLLSEVFKLFDRDGSGSISSGEFYDQMMCCGAPLTKEEVNEIIKTVDEDGNGVIDLTELANMLRKESGDDDDKSTTGRKVS